MKGNDHEVISMVRRIFAVSVLSLSLCLSLCLSLPVAAGAEEAPQQAATYKIDRAHSSVGFSVRHFFNQVPGRFTGFKGSLVYDAERPESSKIELFVDVSTITTDLERRDKHLRSGDFFDAENHPEMWFKSTSVRSTGEKSLAVTGDFHLRGKTQRLTVPVEILGVMELGGGAAKAAFRAQLTIDRLDFGVSWNQQLDGGGTLLGNEVDISIVLQADRELR